MAPPGSMGGQPRGGWMAIRLRATEVMAAWNVAAGRLAPVAGAAPSWLGAGGASGCSAGGMAADATASASSSALRRSLARRSCTHELTPAAAAGLAAATAAAEPW